MSDLDADLADMTAALRASADEAPVDATATRLKIRESLAPRKKRFGWLIGGGLLFAGSVSWALATGQVSRLFWSKSPPVVAPAAAIAKPVVAMVAPAPDPGIGNEEGEGELGMVAPRVPAAPAPRPRPVPVHHSASPSSFPIPGSEQPSRAPVPVEEEPLYKHAHELHFHGTDATASLAAWDAYLANNPTGRFAVEARYNRAVDLIKLDRLADAQQALAPFAAGDVDPHGYRQAEAVELTRRIVKRLNGSK